VAPSFALVAHHNDVQNYAVAVGQCSDDPIQLKTVGAYHNESPNDVLAEEEVAHIDDVLLILA
jgi:hypothetical protein